MHSLKTSFVSLLGFLAWSSAIPLSSLNPNHLLSTRQALQRNGVIPDYMSPVCKYKGGALTDGIHDVYRLAHAARKSHLSRFKANVFLAWIRVKNTHHPRTIGAALRSPNITAEPWTDGVPEPDDFQTPLDPAPHYFYFFDNDLEVATFVDTVFETLTHCAWTKEKRKPEDSCVIPTSVGCAVPDDHRCKDGAYGFVTPAGSGTRQRDQIFMCDRFLETDDSPDYCSTPGGALNTNGYALLYQIVQMPEYTVFNQTFLQQKTGNSSITQVNGPGGFNDTLSAIGYGTGGEGLKGKGLANAKNYAAFAQWSLDLGYDSGDIGYPDCTANWNKTVEAEGLEHVGRNLLELGKWSG
ncbi:MAG: hypothetical protein Q9183_006975 [Haloplaca sp. 2 TL-2023]